MRISDWSSDVCSSDLPASSSSARYRRRRRYNSRSLSLSESTVTSGSFPRTRLRRTRQAPHIRTMVRETSLAPGQLIQPLFVAEGALKGPVAAMPGVTRLDLDELVRECEALRALGVGCVALFPVTPAERKSPGGDEAQIGRAHV